MNTTTLLLHGLEVLTNVPDPEADPAAVRAAAAAARILAFVKAEGVLEVLEAVRDACDVAVDMREEPNGREKDHHIIALSDASAAISDAVARLRR